MPAKPGRRELAPADLKKDAGRFDLPVALGLLLGSGQVALDRPGAFAIVGELALTGETRPIKGVLAMVLLAASSTATAWSVSPATAPGSWRERTESAVGRARVLRTWDRS